MSKRRKIMELFESQKAFTAEKVKCGIEENRKGWGQILLKDKDGNPIKNAKITIKQKNHEFKFGANLFMLDELESEEKNEKYKKAFSDIFNMATLPFYWDSTEPQKGHTRYSKDSEKLYRRPPIDLCMEFCEKHNIEPREHALAYEHFFPDWLKNASVFEVKSAYEKRCREISERYADKIPTIEVINEMQWRDGIKTSFYKQPDFVEWCFKTAEKYFPQNELVVNEWTGLPWADACNYTDRYYSYIEANLLKGARIDAIGMQFHMFNTLEDEYNATRDFYNPKSLYEHLDLYSNLNKPIQVTEITIPAYSNSEKDEDLQAEIIKQLYMIWFSHKNVEQIIYWNLVDGYAAFAPQGDMTAGENYYYGGLLRFDLSPKPAYFALKDLIQKQWHTEEIVTTDENGKAMFKGFYGDYDLEITNSERTKSENVKLGSKADNEFCIEF